MEINYIQSLLSQKNLSSFVLGCLALILASCGGGGGGTTAPTNTTPIGDLTGNWSVTENVDASDCGSGTNIDEYTLVATQSGSSLTVVTNTGNFTGNISGDKLTWNGSFSEDGGTTQSSVALIVASSCNSLSGSADWSWSDGVTSCSGTTQVSATRNDPVGCGASAASAPDEPTSLSATVASESSITLKWMDNSTDEASFVVQRSTSSGSSFSTIATLSVGTSMYVNTGLSASTTYYYRVYASNGNGNSAYSNEAFATTAITPASIPVAPGGLTVSETSTSSITLNWMDASSDETNFVVQRSNISSIDFITIATLGAGTTTYVNTDLTASTKYYYRVYAVNSSGNSAFSNEAFATTDAPLAIIPTAPGGLTATETSSSNITLNWTDNSTDETGFVVERSNLSGSGFIMIVSLTADTTSYVDTGLSASTTYYYRVYASNDAGDSGFSNEANATTGTELALPLFAGFDNINFAVGNYYDYEFHQTSTTNGSNNAAKHGVVRIELVNSVVRKFNEIGDVTLYETKYYTLSGDDPPFGFPWWRYIAAKNGVMYISDINFNLATLFDSYTGKIYRNGFMGYFSSTREETVTVGTINNQFITTSAVVVNEPFYDPSCETIAGVTICDDESHNYQVKEYYIPHIGFGGFHRSGTSIFTGGGFTDIFTNTFDVGLINTNAYDMGLL